MMNPINSISLLTFVIGGTMAFTACSEREKQGSENSTHEMRGIVRQVRPVDSTVVIEHEDVPGFMPAMTMPFNLRDNADFGKLSSGGGVEFELVTTEDDSWIRNIRQIDASSVNLPEKEETISKDTRKVDRLKEGDVMPDFKLTDQDGKAITGDDCSGKDLLLTFIFTRCGVPNFCPLMSKNFAEIEKVVAADPALKSRVRLMSISLDPEYDTPEVLKAYAARNSDNPDLWRFASGTAEQTEALTSAFAVYTESADGTINHGLTTAWIGSDGTVRQLWRGNGWKPEEVLDALK